MRWTGGMCDFIKTNVSQNTHNVTLEPEQSICDSRWKCNISHDPVKLTHIIL